MTKTAFNTTKILFTSQLDSNLAKKPMAFGTQLCVVLQIEHCGKQIRNSLKVSKVVLEKDGDQLDRSCEK